MRISTCRTSLWKDPKGRIQLIARIASMESHCLDVYIHNLHEAKYFFRTLDCPGLPFGWVSESFCQVPKHSLGMESHAVAIETGQGKQGSPAGTRPRSADCVTQEQTPAQTGTKLTNAAPAACGVRHGTQTRKDWLQTAH